MVVLPLQQYSDFQNKTTQNGGAVKTELTQLNHAPCGQPTAMYHEHKTLHQLHAVDADSGSAAQKITHQMYPIGSLPSYYDPAPGLYPERTESSPQLQARFKMNLNTC
jgi:hypothetical protein